MFGFELKPTVIGEGKVIGQPKALLFSELLKFGQHGL